MSLLTNVGLPELIAQSPREYVDKAAAGERFAGVALTRRLARSNASIADNGR